MNEIPEIANPIASAKVVGDNISFEGYARQSVLKGDAQYMLGRSDLAEFANCPKKWKLKSDIPGESTEATEWGILMDCIKLTPGEFEKRFAVCPETYPDAKTKEPKPWTFAANYCKDWREQQGDKTIVKAADYLRAKAAEFAFDKDSQDLIDNSKRQVMVVGTYLDKDTGLEIPLKGLIDLVPDAGHPKWGGCLADLKTTTNASPWTWAKEINTYRLHWQAALYLDLWVAATNEDRNTFRHVVQENKEPFISGRRILSVEFLNLGRMQYLDALKRYCQCVHTQTWPDYEQDGFVIDGWTVTQPEAWMIS